MNTHKQNVAKFNREVKKEIEANLHPCPTINGLEILHRHVGQKIIFSAWKGEDPANKKELHYSRVEVWCTPNFYTARADDFEYLTK